MTLLNCGKINKQPTNQTFAHSIDIVLRTVAMHVFHEWNMIKRKIKKKKLQFWFDFVIN